MHTVNLKPETKRCRACNQFDLSKLARHGYCKAAPDFELRSQLLPDETVCLYPVKYLSGGHQQ